MQRAYSYCARALVATAAALLLGALFVGTAAAHSHLVSSNPAGGAVLGAEPATVSATYEEDVSLTKSTFQVYYQPDASSPQVPADNGSGHVDVNQRTLMSATLQPGLGPGIYTVKWHTVTEDDNGQVDGSFTFTVKGLPSAGGSAATPTDAPVISPAPAGLTPTPAPAFAPAPGGGEPLPTTGTGPDGLALAAGLAVIAALVLLSGLVLRRAGTR